MDIAGSTQLKHTHDIAALEHRIQGRQNFLEGLEKNGHIQFLNGSSCTSISPEHMLSVSLETHDWIAILKMQFDDFHSTFLRNIDGCLSATDHTVPLDNIKNVIESKGHESIWKCLGDELLYSFNVATNIEVFLLCKAFLKTLHEFDCKALRKENSSKSTQLLRVKGTAWLANFPIRNRATTLFGRNDFFGLDMDIGFRIAKLTVPGILCINFDLAHIFSQQINDGESDTFVGGIMGWEGLKGVWDGKRYPVIWLVDGSYTIDDANRAFPEWKEDEGKRVAELKKFLSGAPASRRLTGGDTPARLHAAYKELHESLHLPKPCVIDPSNPPQKLSDGIKLLNCVCKGQAGEQQFEAPRQTDADREGEAAVDLLTQRQQKAP